MDLPLQWSGALRGVLVGHQLAQRHRVRDLRRECLRRELRRRGPQQRGRLRQRCTILARGARHPLDAPQPPLVPLAALDAGEEVEDGRDQLLRRRRRHGHGRDRRGGSTTP
eukprot:scaffold58799_cov63-Phaeocystis_antarctica.AAC.2